MEGITLTLVFFKENILYFQYISMRQAIPEALKMAKKLALSYLRKNTEQHICSLSYMIYFCVKSEYKAKKTTTLK